MTPPTVYIINLESKTDRWLAMRDQFIGSGMVPERVLAVDGTLSDGSGIARALAAQEVYRAPLCGLTQTEVAVFLSHRQCWRDIKNTGLSGLVLEDDVFLSTKFFKFVFGLETLVTSPSVIKLETTLRRLILGERPRHVSLNERQEIDFLPLLSWHGGAAAYLMNPSAASLLLEATRRLEYAVDEVMFLPQCRPQGLEVLQAIPGLAVQRGLHSEKQGVRVAKDSPFASSINRSKRVGLAPHERIVSRFRRLSRRLREWLNRARLQRLGFRYVLVPFDEQDA